jgi:tellurite resistance protein
MIPALTPQPFWKRTPPGLLSVCLGLIGCGLAWRTAARVLGAPEAVGQLWLGAAGAVFALCAFLYLRKVIDRPGALSHDLRMPAGRGAVSAGSMTLMLGGAALAPLSASAGTLVWAAGVILHAYVAVALLRELAGMPADGRPAIPGLYLPFVGQIVAPVGGVSLGFWAVSAGLFWLAVGVWAALTPFILRRLARASAPPPFLRPGVAILLAPPAIGLVAYDRLYPEGWLVWPMFALAGLALFGLVTRVGWLIEGGWTLGWGAFTFPCAAFAGASLVMAERQIGPAWDWVAIAALVSASLLTLYIAARTAEAALKGELAPV